MRAEIYFNVGKEYELAIKDYDKIIELDPDYGGTYHDRALAYQQLGNSYRAIHDFTKAIEAKKKSSGVGASSAYENRAQAYVSVSDYENAIKDFTRAIGIKVGDYVLLMNVSQFRTAYPEYNDMTDEALAKKLHRKFLPNLKYEDFARQFLKENKDFDSSTVPELYVKRGDAYLNLGYYTKAIEDYNRVKAFPTYAKYFEEWGRWKLFATNSVGEYYIDIKTITYPVKGNVRFWTKGMYNKPQKDKVAYSIQNVEINQSSRMIKVISFNEYDSAGNLLNIGGPGVWDSIVPGSIGEVLYEGWFREIK